MEARGNFLIPGDDDMGQRVIPTDKTASKEPREEIISFTCNNNMSSDIQNINIENQI